MQVDSWAVYLPPCSAVRRALNKQNKVRRVEPILLKDCTSRSTSRVEYTNNVCRVESITLKDGHVVRRRSTSRENKVFFQYVNVNHWTIFLGFWNAL